MLTTLATATQSFDPFGSIIIPAVVAFAVVGIEVVLARRWDRMMRMSELVEDLTAVLGEYLSQVSDSAMDRGLVGKQSYIRLQARTFTTLSAMRTLARWPLKHHRQVRDEVERLMAKVIAAQQNAKRGKGLAINELKEGFRIQPIREALHGEMDTLDSEVEFYMEHRYLDGDPPRWSS